MFPLNRVVVLLSPFFAGVSAWIVTRVAEFMPGVNLDETELTALFIAAFLAAAEMARQWLKGWQKHEENEVILEVNGLAESSAGEANRERAAEEGGLDLPEPQAQAQSTLGAKPGQRR